MKKLSYKEQHKKLNNKCIVPKKNTIFCYFKKVIGWRINRKAFLEEFISCKIVIYVCNIWCLLRFTYCVKQCGSCSLEERWWVFCITPRPRTCKSLQFQVNLYIIIAPLLKSLKLTLIWTQLLNCFTFVKGEPVPNLIPRMMFSY